MKKTDKLKHWARINNRAQWTNEPPQTSYCDSCSNHLLFAMRDYHHEFTLGITTLLECLMAAEDQGAVPVLPNDWWNAVISHYKLDRPRFEDGQTLSEPL